MSNISKAFNNTKAFIPFLTGGDPTIDKTEEYIYKMVEAGADIIEIKFGPRTYHHLSCLPR